MLRNQVHDPFLLGGMVRPSLLRDSLHRHLRAFIAYYHRTRTHLALTKDAPLPRPVQKPDDGRVVAIPEVGGLHHRYERRAA